VIVADAAREVGISHDGILKAIRRGRLVAHKMGPLWVIRRPELERFKAAYRKPGPKPRLHDPQP
jgi:excisionase family DNA binding protein